MDRSLHLAFLTITVSISFTMRDDIKALCVGSNFRCMFSIVVKRYCGMFGFDHAI